MPSLRTLVREALEEVAIDRHYSAATLTAFTASAAFTRLAHAFRTGKHTWLTEPDVIDILCTAVDRFVDRSGRSQSLKSGTKIDQAFSSIEIDDLIESILHAFDRLPRAYHFWFRLSSLGPLGCPDLCIAPGMHVIEVGDSEPFFRILEAAKRANVATAKVEFAKGSLYLRVDTHGYYCGGQNSAHADVLSRLKQLFGLLAASQCAQWTPYWLHIKPSSAALAFDADCTRASPVQVPGPLAAHIANFNVAPASEIKKINLRGALLQETEAETKIEALATRFAAIHAVMSSSGKAHSDHILTAAEWLLDVELEDNETNSLLFTSIGLEALLLSTKDQTSNRLSDRLAYMTGSRQAERAEIANEFARFYSARSDLVHGRARKISPVQRDLLVWGKKMLAQAIRCELRSVSPAS